MPRSACVKGFGYRPCGRVRTGLMACVRKPRGEEAAARGRALWGFRCAAWSAGSCETWHCGARLRPTCPGACGLLRMAQIWDHRDRCFRHWAEQDRPLSGRDRRCFVMWSPPRRRHDVSILTAKMVRGAEPGAKRSTRIMRPPQHGHGARSERSSSVSTRASAS